MKRFSALALAAAGLTFWLGTRTPAQYPCLQPPTAFTTSPTAVPFMGSNYNLTPPSYSASTYSNYFGPSSYMGGPTYSSNYAPPYVVKYNHYVDYTYPRPAYDRSYYYNPGPYYYTQTYPYTSDYYGYYYTPGYFRY